jgi:hypothetical protein
MFDYISYEPSDKAKKFIDLNQDLDLLTHDNIFIRIEDNNGWLKIALVIDEDVSNSSTALRNAAWLFGEWKERLLKFQGLPLWGGNGKNKFMEDLLRMNKCGTSYKQISEMLNQKIESNLRDYLAFRIKIDNIYPEYKQDFDQCIYSHINLPKLEEGNVTLFRSRSILIDLGFKEKKVDQTLRAALDRLKGGEKPFDLGKPISRFMIVDRMRNWREGKHKLIKV